VFLLDTDAETAIALADIALTAYSAAAFDAVIRRTPVVVVTTGDVDYPVDLPAILGAPRARSADELAAIIDDYRAHPQEFRDTTQELLQREDHFVQGPGPGLRALVGEAISAGGSGIRAGESVPASLFLDGPHPVFRV
jgi:CDP-glycerol glycerophosphotransferase (TagB/SpsB family)